MIRTVVCQKEGCSGNRFYIESVDNKLKITCIECNSSYILEESHDYTFISSCTSCRNDTFKLFRDMDENKIFIKCSECGAPPERVYLDLDGEQVSYEAKLLQEIKFAINQMEQRVCNLELKAESVNQGQNIIEESLAYINKYIVEK